MAELAKDFWAKSDKTLPARWPRDGSGQPEKAARLDIQWELDSRADLTVSLLESCETLLKPRIPDVWNGERVSNGTMFLFVVMSAATRRNSRRGTERPRSVFKMKDSGGMLAWTL